MKIAFMTHTGAVRAENQDAVVVPGIVRTGDMDAPEIHEIDLTDAPLLFAAIDGMGGHVGGALAARILAETMADKAGEKGFFPPAPDVNENERALRLLFAEATSRMQAHSPGPGLSMAPMGAVVSGVLMYDKCALAFNVGDCRVYRCSAGNLERLTRDHSPVHDLFEKGKIDEEGMRTHPDKRFINSFVSSDPSALTRLYTRELRLRKGDSLFLCSDGVWEAFSTPELAALLTRKVSLKDKASNLFKTLIKENCNDNVSFIFMKG